MALELLPVFYTSKSCFNSDWMYLYSKSLSIIFFQLMYLIDLVILKKNIQVCTSGVIIVLTFMSVCSEVPEIGRNSTLQFWWTCSGRYVAQATPWVPNQMQMFWGSYSLLIYEQPLCPILEKCTLFLRKCLPLILIQVYYILLYHHFILLLYICI